MTLGRDAAPGNPVDRLAAGLNQSLEMNSRLGDVLTGLPRLGHPLDFTQVCSLPAHQLFVYEGVRPKSLMGHDEIHNAFLAVRAEDFESLR